HRLPRGQRARARGGTDLGRGAAAPGRARRGPPRHRRGPSRPRPQRGRARRAARPSPGRGRRLRRGPRAPVRGLRPDRVLRPRRERGATPACYHGGATGEAEAMTLSPDSRVFVAGHRGLVGSAILRRLQTEGFSRVLVATREQLDLRDQAAVNYWFRANRPEYVFLVAGTVGGILANSRRPAEFIYDNMMIHATVVHAAHLYGVKKLLYLGSSCLYPRLAS